MEKRAMKKSDFRKCLRWMQKVQFESLFSKDVDVHVDTQYTEANDYGRALKPFSINVFVYGKNGHSSDSVEMFNIADHYSYEENMETIKRAGKYVSQFGINVEF